VATSPIELVWDLRRDADHHAHRSRSRSLLKGRHVTGASLLSSSCLPTIDAGGWMQNESETESS
jgi:hypothetical protein